MVYDCPQLRYFLQIHPDPSLAISISEYLYQGYGFAFPLQTIIQHKVNIELLKIQESGKVDRIINEWLGYEQS